ncbi:MAG: S-formylglutathione hydrolase [Pseudomonadota bacterium]
MQLFSQIKSFGGYINRYRHPSTTTHCEMTFSLYLPPLAESTSVPVLYWLSGLTCTDENFMQKAGAQRVASELGIAILCPDTSPRGTNLPGEHESEDFGSGAGFYLNATQAPWIQHYRMYDYIVEELPALVKTHCPVLDKWSISGHSMGGHGALIIALKNPHAFVSASAFAPICNPIDSPWADKIFSRYLGADKALWEEYDATVLIENAQEKLPLFVDQGEADEFLTEKLKPAALQAACEKAKYPLTLRTHHGYGHSYYFIASFIEDHLRYHGKALKGESTHVYY